MDIQLFLIGLACLVFGVIMMSRNRFYNHKTSDMLFAAKIKVFLGAFILFMIGIAVFINELIKLL